MKLPMEGPSSVVEKQRPLWADILLTLLRFILGGLFVVAAFLKLTAPIEQFEAAIRTFEVLPAEFFVHAVALVLPWIELCFGLLLIIGAFIKPALWMHLFQIILYLFLITQGLLRGLEIDCGCFGKALPASPEEALWRDIIMLLIVLILFRWLPTRWSIDGISTTEGKRLSKSSDA